MRALMASLSNLPGNVELFTFLTVLTDQEDAAFGVISRYGKSDDLWRSNPDKGSGQTTTFQFNEYGGPLKVLGIDKLELLGIAFSVRVTPSGLIPGLRRNDVTRSLRFTPEGDANFSKCIHDRHENPPLFQAHTGLIPSWENQQAYGKIYRMKQAIMPVKQAIMLAD